MVLLQSYRNIRSEILSTTCWGSMLLSIIAQAGSELLAVSRATGERVGVAGAPSEGLVWRASCFAGVVISRTCGREFHPQARSRRVYASYVRTARTDRSLVPSDPLCEQA